MGLSFLHYLRLIYICFALGRWTIEVKMMVGGDLEFLSNFGNLVGVALRNLGTLRFRVHVPRL